MPMAKIETTSALIPSLWKGGQPGLSERGAGGRQLEGVGHRPRAGEAITSTGHIQSGHRKPSSWVGPQPWPPSLRACGELCARHCVKHFLYIVSVNPPQEERSPCTLYRKKQEPELRRRCTPRGAERMTPSPGPRALHATGPVQLSSLYRTCAHVEQGH